MFYIENSIKQSDVQNIINLVSSQEEDFKKKIFSIFQKSVSDVSQVTNEFINNWVAVIKKELGPEDTKAFRVICRELAIVFDLSEKYRNQELKTSNWWLSEVLYEFFINLGLLERIYKEEILRAEVAKIAAEKSGSSISLHIQKYSITDQSALVEIAKIAAAQNSGRLSEYIQNYAITDQVALVEIAKIAAAKNARELSIYIQKYGIKEESSLVEIAKVAAAESGWRLSFHIENYEIRNQTDLIEIAKIAAAKDGRGVSQCIQNYGIKEESSLVEIAKVAAAESGWGVSVYIQKYGITAPAALVEIAKIAAEQNGRKVSLYIQKYGIIDQIELLDIFFIGARDRQMIDCRNFLIKKTETENLYPSLLLFQDRALDDLEIEAFIHSVDSSIFKKIGEELAREKNILVRDETLRCLALVCLGCQLKEVPLVNQGEGEKLIKGLLALRNPTMRRAMVSDVVEALKEDTALNKWKDLRAQSTVNSKHALPLMLLASLVESDHYQKIGATFKHRDFKEISRINGLLRCLVMLSKNKTLSLEEKELIVTRLLFGGENPSPKKVYQSALMVLECLSFGKEQEIKEIEDPSLLLGILEREFIERFGLTHTDDFFARFLKFQESFRAKDAIVTYAATLEKLPLHEKELCKPVLQSYVQGIFDGSFKDRRYEKENNPHLQEVFKDPALEEEWKKGAEYSLGPFLRQHKGFLKQDKPIDFRAFFIEKIMRDSHFPKYSISYVRDVLENSISLEESLQKIKEAIKSSGNFDELANFGLQEKMLQLMEPGISSQDAIRIFQSLINSLSKSDPKVELISDLEGNLATLKAFVTKRSQQFYEDWKVVDTDDPALLLVLGSEVSGSCQKVDGDPDLSKCLLDYLMDGKNRALAVVNANGEIQAKCVLRVLWDKKNSSPILFQERIYSRAQCPRQIADVLNQVCLKRAKELNLTFVSETPTSKVYPNPVYSLASVAPFEYVDAKGTGVTQGKWSLEKVFVQSFSFYSKV